MQANQKAHRIPAAFTDCCAGFSIHATTTRTALTHGRAFCISGGA